jgi:putative PIN family toxin of toxin-antitoxin system
MKQPKVVLDTNVLLVSVSSKSRLHWIFTNLLQGSYILCVTTDILAEYAEIIEQQMGELAGESILGVLENLPNVELVTAYYKFGLLADPDDNKFVDCAIACNAHFIVTHDKDFNILKKIDFPKVIVVDSSQFHQILENTSEKL